MSFLPRESEFWKGEWRTCFWYVPNTWSRVTGSVARDGQQEHTVVTVDMDLNDVHQNYSGSTNPAQLHLQETTTPFQE